jgi:predicted HTH transcriptional regulator
MGKIKIFISSVQKEFSQEREQLSEYILSDSLLGLFFKPFLFEQLPAIDTTAKKLYLNEVKQCDIYLALLGEEYGFEDQEGVSPTEREFDTATESNKIRLIYIKKTTRIHPRQEDFINKVQNVLVRKSFSTISELKSGIYDSLVNYLIDKEFIRTAPFDADLNLKASISDIDVEKLRNFIQLAKLKRGFPLSETAPIETILTHLNLLEKSKITNAAILLFGKNPQRFFITSDIRCASFYGNTVEKPIPSYKVFKGDLFELIEQALEFVLNKLDYRIETREKHPSIPGSYEIPKDVITEAIVNAVVHRDYNSNASVQIMVFRNRIEIWNPGMLPLGWTTDKLKKIHNSVPKNPLIAEPMYLTGYIERLGTGTTDIINKSKNAGLAEPKFIQENMFRTIIYREQKGHNLGSQPESQPESQLIGRILVILEGAELSKSLISKKLGQKSISGELNKKIKYMLKNDFIERTIPEKPNSRLQKYRLTRKGLSLKNRITKDKN